MARGAIVLGGKKAERFFARAAAQIAQGVDAVTVGWPATARYPPVRTGLRGGDEQKPELVGHVAAKHEFGIDVPMRPFMRQAQITMQPVLRAQIKQALSADQVSVDERIAGRLGEWMKGQVQESITRLDRPRNSSATIKAKGSSNPLIDTGFMRASVTWEVAR